MKSKKLLITGLVALALGISTPNIVRQITKSSKIYEQTIKQEKLEQKVTNIGKVEKIGLEANEITVLYVKGSPYEMGFQHGKLLKNDVQKCIKGILDNCYKFIKKETKLPLINKTITNFILDEAYKKIEPHIPKDYKEEMQGLADGSNVSLKDIQKIHAIPSLTETSCSAFVAFRKATKDKNIYQLRILDYIMDFGIQDYPTIVVYQPNKGNSFANITWAGFTGVISGMNKEGIALSEMGYGDPKDNLPGIPNPAPEETIDGIPMPFLFKKILQQANNVEQATGIIKAAERTNYFVYIIGDGITKNKIPGARGFITTKESCNIYTDNDPNYPIPALDDIIYGSHDNEKCYQLLNKFYGEINPSIIMEKINPEIAMKINLQCVIYDPKNLKIWVANAKGSTGRACEQEYVLFNFGKAIE